MPQDAATWHYVVAAFLLLILGVAAHVARAVFNLYPDRLSDRPMMDLMISDGFDWNDWLFGTEYDENGYYRLDSLKNLRLSCSYSMFGGLAGMLLVPGASASVAQVIDDGLLSLYELWLYRWENLRLL
ncbi:hypothetical protein [Rhizobium sp. SL42]|uniref:hypothetical protein n=1 Tax=Rhizobium sp. SL42 TaxID=2806346 RepID=UPI001F41547A|nr:hypothetical protein [Rhizobium sp. SL42]UJW74297.1 hypothetical protein IM739_15715 [Rhizobium sp. SL42]